MAKTYAEIICDEIRAAGFTVGTLDYVNEDDRVMYVADAWRENDGRHRYIARADSDLGAWVALKHAIWEDDKLWRAG